ncbi:hypothetical protein SCHPADRAFT_934782 [Schizopora paradoxa]|uniref:Transmembrane protein n=1 Tax=Schizopora paradoxa TaxID=27342 RepID=A0A0H2S7D5_9AGAM|nr:hypothetical protein SCHPADRAFT_934782 [Schizopora paradoxa]
MVPASVLLLFLLVFTDAPGLVGALSLSRTHTSSGRLSLHRVRANKAPTSLFEDPFLLEENARSSHVPPKRPSHKAKAKDLDPFGFFSDSTAPDASSTAPKGDKTNTDLSSTEEESKHTATKTNSDTTQTSANMESAPNVPATLAPLSLASSTSLSPDSFTFSGTMPGPIATSFPTPSVSSTDGSDAKSSGGIGMSNWKVVGIGVLVVGGIAITVAGFTFFDCWWAFVSQPCGRRKGRKFDHLGNEELMPDWNRGSWRIGLEEQNDWSLKPGMSPDLATLAGREGQEATREKSNFISLPPPVHPFALRRSPDTNTTLVNYSSSNMASSSTSLSEKSTPKPNTPPMARISRKAPESIIDTVVTPSISQGDSVTVKRQRSKDKKKMRKSSSAPNFTRQSRLFLINPDEAEAYGGVAGLGSPTPTPDRQ